MYTRVYNRRRERNVSKGNQPFYIHCRHTIYSVPARFLLHWRSTFLTCVVPFHLHRYTFQRLVPETAGTQHIPPPVPSCARCTATWNAAFSGFRRFTLEFVSTSARFASYRRVFHVKYFRKSRISMNPTGRGRGRREFWAHSCSTVLGHFLLISFFLDCLLHKLLNFLNFDTNIVDTFERRHKYMVNIEIVMWSLKNWRVWKFMEKRILINKNFNS